MMKYELTCTGHADCPAGSLRLATVVVDGSGCDANSTTAAVTEV